MPARSGGANGAVASIKIPHHVDARHRGERESGDDSPRAIFSPEETVQIACSRQVIDALLAKVVMVRSYLLAAIALVSFVTLVMIGLVIALSARLRQPEIVTMWKIGCARHTIASILACQVGVVFLISAVLALLMTLATNHFGPDLVRALAF